MDKILIIADGILAKYFLERLCAHKGTQFFFVVLYYEDESVNLALASERVRFVKFDPTSARKLESLISQDFKQVFIYMQKELDARASFENLRALNSELDIVLMDFWGLNIEDKHCDLIDVRGILSNRLLNFLPDTAHTAQFVGLGVGEIMEVKIPAGSSFAYRHIGSIEQRKWRIALVYRNAKMLFASPSLMLLPNDSMLILGEPSVLEGVFRRASQNFGQFPSPFGNNILCVLDMKKEAQELENELESALFLHSKINSKKLFLRVINPNLSPLYERLKNIDKNSISVYFDYKFTHFDESFLSAGDIGLIMLDNALFERHKKLLFRLKVPVMKFGSKALSSVKEAVILSSEESELEKQANVMIDLGKQLDIQVLLYHYALGSEISQVLEHFKALSKLYDKELKIIEVKDKNPLFEFSKRSDVLEFISFNQSLTGSNFGAGLSMDFNRLYYKMHENYQVFIPVS